MAPSHYLNQCWNIANWTLGTNFGEILIEIYTFSLKKGIWKCRLDIGGHFISASMFWGKFRIIARFQNPPLFYDVWV